MRTPRTKAGRLEARQIELNYLASKGWDIEHHETPAAIVCRKTRQAQTRTGETVERFDLKIFKGTAAKPLAYYTFRSEERREEYAARTLASITTHQVSRKGEQAADHYMVGDVLYASWGYDQTNINFFEVVRVSGKSIWIREIAQNSSDPGNCSSGFTQPRRGHFLAESLFLGGNSRSNAAKRKAVQKGGTVSHEFVSLSKWDGKALYCSSYH